MTLKNVKKPGSVSSASITRHNCVTENTGRPTAATAPAVPVALSLAPAPAHTASHRESADDAVCRSARSPRAITTARWTLSRVPHQDRISLMLLACRHFNSQL